MVGLVEDGMGFAVTNVDVEQVRFWFLTFIFI
jgi:hypothetical protein